MYSLLIYFVIYFLYIVPKKNLLNFQNANHSTKNSKFSGSKVQWKKNFWEKNFENLGLPREVTLFWTFWKMLFHSLLEVAENSNRAFWLNGKRPL